MANLFELVKIILFCVAIGVVWGIISGITKKKSARCKNCKIYYSYERDVAWEVLSSTTGKAIFGDPKSKVRVAIACRCSRCGKIKRFTRKYTCAEYKKGIFSDSIRAHSIEELIRRDFILP